MDTIEKKNERTRAQTVPVSRLPNVTEVERELEWFFAMAEGEMGEGSNYESTLAPVVPDCFEPTAEDRVEAARMDSKILARLRAMPSADAGVLQAAYEPEGWPLRLREEFGTLTGLVVRLACGEMGLPEDRHEMKGMERRVSQQLDDACRKHGFKPIERLRVRAQDLLNQAHHVYVEVRAKEKRQEKRETPSPAKSGLQPTSGAEGLPVRAFYKIAELARAVGMTRWRIEQMLEQAGVEFYVPGSVVLVPLHELETKVTPLWEGIKAAERLRQVARATGVASPSSSQRSS